MHLDGGRIRHLLGWQALLVLAIGAAITAAAALGADRDRRSATDREFQADSERARVLIQARVDTRTGIQELLRDAVVAQWPIGRQEFRHLVVNSTGRDMFDEVQAVSFNRLVPAERRAAYEQTVRSSSTDPESPLAEFTVRPATTNFDDLIVVEHLEPTMGNEAALGLDIGTDEARRGAVERARDSGALIATAPVTLVQDTGDQRGVLLISAVYDTTEPLVSAPSRRRHFVGVVVTVVRTDTLLTDALGTNRDVAIEVFDQGLTIDRTPASFGATSLVFDSDDELDVRADGTNRGRSDRLDLSVGGRRWSMITTPGPEFSTTGIDPLVVLAIGLLLTGALATSVSAITNARERAERLADQRTRDLLALVESAPDATIVVDADGRIVLASDLVEDLLGYRPDDLIGYSVDDLVPIDRRDNHHRHRARYAAEPAPRMMGGALELEALRADGTKVAVEVSLSPLPEHSIGTVVAAMRDVSVQRKAHRELEHANEMKSAFLATVSHELRTPLTAIGGFARLLQKQGTLDDATRALFIDRIVGNTQNLDNLITEIIDFSRLGESGSLTPEPHDLMDLSRQIIDRLGHIVEDHDLQLDGDSTVAYVDDHAYTRILTNLMTNAVRYSPSGGVVAVRVSAPATPAGPATVTVDDEGPGIPAEERERIFERFWRGSAARATNNQGSGVGLAVVSELCAHMGGSVTIENSPLGGARFSVALPSRQPDRQRAEPPAV